jgi:hypothetical protein
MWSVLSLMSPSRISRQSEDVVRSGVRLFAFNLEARRSMNIGLINRTHLVFISCSDCHAQWYYYDRLWE